MNCKKRDLLLFWKKSNIVSDKSVINAFKKINRENFVLDEYKHDAYDDHPLPILGGQTISQPTTVVLMLQALELKSGQRVLEIGAGSGYNAALISKIIGKGRLFSLEIVPELADFAKTNLEKQCIENVKVIHSDGIQGFKQQAPFDRIIVTAAAPEVPKLLVDQLKNNGVLLMPVGPRFNQHMLKIRKLKNKTFTEDFGEFLFVPLRGKFGLK